MTSEGSAKPTKKRRGMKRKRSVKVPSENASTSENDLVNTNTNNDEEESEIKKDTYEEKDSSISDVEEKLEEEHPETKQKKTGVLYFSTIPPYFTPTRLKLYFEKKAPGMIGRVYLERNKNSRTPENRYSEGWLEIKRKKLAKILAATIDNTPIGGKKRDYVSSILWNIKYLSGFKWVHLMEQLQYEKAVEGQRMQAEISQAKRIASYFEEQVEKGRHLKKLEEKTLKEGGLWEKFQRQITQKKAVKTKAKGNLGKKKAKDDEVMKMIFAE